MYLPADLPGGLRNPYTALVGIQWRADPLGIRAGATWMHLAAALVGGSRPWLTIWVLMIVTAIAFLVVGYLLLRSAANPVRAGLLWAANPLLIYLFVMSAPARYLRRAGRDRGDPDLTPRRDRPA